MAFEYNGNVYGSKAAVVRDLYDAGEITMDVQSKKDIASKLQMTVQTVHATLTKHIGIVKVSKPEKNTKITPAIDQSINKSTHKTKNRVVIIDDQDPEKQNKLKSNEHVIKVTWAPNQWSLPVTNPPIEVIDKNYDPNWVSKIDEEEIERNWD